MHWFNAGITAMAMLLGFLVGASHSPVAGVAITAAFGLLAAVFAFNQKATFDKAMAVNFELFEHLDRLRPQIRGTLNALGRTLLVFAIAFAVGLACGIYLRVGQPFSPAKAPATFPWEGLTAPISGQSAIDWLLVQDKLRSMGYRDDQIRALYEKDRKSRGEPRPTRFGELLSPLFSSIPSGNRTFDFGDIRFIAEDSKPRPWGGVDG